MNRLVVALGAALVLVGILLWRAQGTAQRPGVELLNVSYDPTRELYTELNALFCTSYGRDAGHAVRVRQSHGGSTSQARAVIDGLDADVVTLALWSDVDAIRRKGLIAEGWERRLPHGSAPYHSTIVFVVRHGNPKGIQDWPDLVRPGVKVITPNPKTGGGAKLNFLAAWGSVVRRKAGGGSEDEAREYMARLFGRVPVLDTGARGATLTFAQKGIGDVHLTWENEAHLEVQESAGRLQIVYPPLSIRASPPVAVVDANVDRKSTRAAAEAYLRFLYTPEAQEVVARHHYRPGDPAVAARHAGRFPALTLFELADLGLDADAAQRRFFAEGALFDQIYQKPRE